MAIQHTRHRGIPYPDSEENVDDARHWQQAMTVVDTELHNVRHNATAEVESRVDTRIQQQVPPLVRSEVETNVTHHVDNRLSEQVPGMVSTGVTDALAQDDTVASAAAAAAETAIADGIDDVDLMKASDARAEFVTATRLTEQQASQPTPMTQTAQDTHEITATVPYLYDESTIVWDETGNRMVDGAQFFTMIKVGDKPGNWRDMYYGYVSGHGYGGPIEKGYIWLVTAPSPYGPWTFGEALIGTGNLPLMESHLVGPRTLAPEVMWVGDEIWITYHGGRLTEPWEPDYNYENRWGAPSVLAKSTDGINFTEYDIVLDLDRRITDLSPYAASTSYRRTVIDNGIWHTIWQANTTYTNEQAGIQTYTVGHATSINGIDWVKHPPLIRNKPGDQGPFSPSLAKVRDGWLIVGTYRRNVDGQQVGLPHAWFGKELKPGAFRSLGDIHLPEREGRSQRPVQSPFFFYHDNILHMAYGNTVNPAHKSVISLAKVGWK